MKDVVKEIDRMLTKMLGSKGEERIFVFSLIHVQ